MVATNWPWKSQSQLNAHSSSSSAFKQTKLTESQWKNYKTIPSSLQVWRSHLWHSCRLLLSKDYWKEATIIQPLSQVKLRKDLIQRRTSQRTITQSFTVQRTVINWKSLSTCSLAHLSSTLPLTWKIRRISRRTTHLYRWPKLEAQIRCKT